MKYVARDEGQVEVKQDYSKRIIFKPDDFDQSGHLLQTVTIPPQTKQRLHWHTKQTEVFYILEGECEIYVNDEMYKTKPGDAFICAPNDTHYLWNKSDKEFSLAVFKVGLSKEDETKWVE